MCESPPTNPPHLFWNPKYPLPMKTMFQKFLASYLFAYLMLGLQILIVMLMFVEHLTPLQFILCTVALWIVCSVVVAYLKDM